MGLIDSIHNLTDHGLHLFGFDKRRRISQNNKTFPYEEGYITSSDVYSVTSKIARNGKSIPWILKINDNGEVRTVEKGDSMNSDELLKLIKQPNITETREQFVEHSLLFLLLSGETFQRSIIPIGFTVPEEVSLLNPQFIEIKVGKQGTLYFPVKYTFEGGIVIPLEEVEHLKYANPTRIGTTQLRGLSPLVAGYLTLIGLNNNQEANANILEHQGAAGILSNEAELPLTEPERKQQQNVLDKLIAGIRNYGKVVQSSAKIKFTRLGLAPDQLKIIESKIMKFRDLCSIYDTKSILFNDPVNASFRNLETAEKSHFTCAVIPNVWLVVRAFEKAVVEKFNQRDFPNGKSRYFIDLDLSKIEVLQADQKL